MNTVTRIPAIFRLLVKNLKETIKIPADRNADKNLESIRSNVEVRGSNFWILFCGSMLASLGLDINSAAVIIGAMLVSPLMSPILGVGLGIGINDKPLLMKSLKNFGIAVFLSLLTSLIYFFITPLGTATPEIIARTSPTLLDAAIAFFGGMAGMVANSRKDMTNAVPGVAIATALMPPLCTSGFGLATGDTTVFMGAFYLFFINAVIISLSTYIVCRMLKLPYVELLDGLTKRKVHRWISVFVTIVIIPSALILYNVIKDANINQKISSFIRDNISNGNRDVLQWERVNLDSVWLVKAYLVGEKIPDQQMVKITRSFNRLGLEGFRLKLIHMNMTEEERRQLTNQAAVDVLRSMELNQNIIRQKQLSIDSLKEIAGTQNSDSSLLEDVSKEIKVIFPEVSTIGFTRDLLSPEDSAATARVPVLMVTYKRGLSFHRKVNIMPRLEGFIKRRMKLDSIKIYQVQ